MGIATTALRVTLGGIMAGHGLQKLAGKFNGPGLDATAAGFEQMGFQPGRPYATAAALTETVGGSLLAAGALTPLGAAMVTGVMGVAIAKVHYRNGLWVTKGGYEYNLLIIGAAFGLTEVGPGPLAIDGLITKRRRGWRWAVAELVAGLVGSAIVIQLNERGVRAAASRNGPGPSGVGPEAATAGGASGKGSPGAGSAGTGPTDAGSTDAGPSAGADESTAPARIN